MNVGIDLGTTYSLLSRISVEGKTILIPDHSYQEVFSTPSKVYLGRNRALVGYLVDLILEQNPSLQVLRFFKREMGNPHPIFYDSLGNPWHPESITALLLKKMRYDAEQFSGENLDSAVITVPAHFNDKQRKAVLNAANLADLPVLGLIEEPVAAAMHYGITQKQKEMIILVYDLGGGTFDATVLTLNEQGVFVLSKNGISELGGKEFDEKIAAYILDKFEFVYKDGIELSAATLLQLGRISEEVKIELSSPNVLFHKKRIILGDKSLEVLFSRKDFESSISGYIDETITCVKSCVEGAGLSVKDIDAALLVGGSSMIPMIREALNSIFSAPKQKVLFHEPMRAVAYGAALHAAQLTGQGEALGIPPELKGISGYHLGIKTVNPVSKEIEIEVLIKKNLPLPVQTNLTCYTTKQRQDNIVIELVQFLDKPENAISIGHLVVGPLPIPKVNYAVEVRIDHTEDGTIKITAYDPQTGVELQKTFGQENNDGINLLRQRNLVKGIQINNFF